MFHMGEAGLACQPFFFNCSSALDPPPAPMETVQHLSTTPHEPLVDGEACEGMGTIRLGTAFISGLTPAVDISYFYVHRHRFVLRSVAYS